MKNFILKIKNIIIGHLYNLFNINKKKKYYQEIKEKINSKNTVYIKKKFSE